MALVQAKEGGSMSYQVPILTPTNYQVWAVKVKSIMEAYGIWEAVEPRVGVELDPKKSKQALAFLFQAISEEIVIQMVDSMKRLLDSMPTSFLQILASIEQCFELDTMLFDEAVGRLKTYEERIKGTEKMESIQGGLLLASEEKIHGCKHRDNGCSNRNDFGRGRGRDRGSVNGRDANERVRDKSRVRCFKCGGFGHFNNECPTWEKEANLIEDDPTLL
ncbi:uncharacterized protein [Rutidosis leptorrhynchoides]|uniref:uncharacterized protein n=1 Tax=Rutidosis leptorrhynchoides TaxID=125765 RepID=UPI003A9A4E6F